MEFISDNLKFDIRSLVVIEASKNRSASSEPDYVHEVHTYPLFLITVGIFLLD